MFYIPDMYSPALALAYTNEPEPWITANLWLGLAVLIPLLLISVVSFVGLYFFKSWGRTLSFYTTLAAFPLSLLVGPSVEGSIESALFEVSTLLWGAILALAYYSPLTSKFVTLRSSGL